MQALTLGYTCSWYSYRGLPLKMRICFRAERGKQLPAFVKCFETCSQKFRETLLRLIEHPQSEWRSIDEAIAEANMLESSIIIQIAIIPFAIVYSISDLLRFAIRYYCSNLSKRSVVPRPTSLHRPILFVLPAY